MKKILLLWAYGQRNIWDEALLEASIKILHRDSKHLIYANSMTPQDSAEEYKEVLFFNTNIKKDFIKFIKYFFSSDIIVYGWWSLLVELKMNKLNKRTPLIRMFIFNVLGKIMRKKIVYLWIWAEYVSPWLSVFLMKSLLKCSDIFYMRDDFSRQVILDYWVKKEKTFLIPDIVHTLGSKKHDKKWNSNFNICIIPVCRVPNRDENYEAYIESLWDFIINEVKKWNSITLCGMRFEESDNLNDLVAIDDIKEHINSRESKILKDIQVIWEYLSPKNFSQTISQYDMVYSSRFHWLIYSINVWIPCVSLSNFPKSRYLLEEANLWDVSLNEKTLSFNKLQQIQNDLEKNYSSFVDIISRLKDKKNLIFTTQLETMYKLLKK